MTARQMYDFFNGQIEWYMHQNEFVKDQIKWYTDQIKRERAQDKETRAHMLKEFPDSHIIRSMYEGKYVSSETRKLLNRRDKYYREAKHNEKMIAHYTAERDDIERYIG